MPRHLDSLGARLRQAREVRGVTAVALARELGIGSASLTHYERGQHTPTPYIFTRIAEILGFRSEFFLTPINGSAVESVIFARSRSAVTKNVRRRAEHRRTWTREVIDYLSQYLSFPQLDIPLAGLKFDWRTASDDEIEELASEVRSLWHLTSGPISNVTLLSENHGVVAVRFPFGSAALDAFSTWDPIDGRPYVVLGADGQSAFRTRFNVCHELGHLVMHKSVTEADLSEVRNFKHVEQQAHRFAGAFLVPAQSFIKDINDTTLDALRALKPRWKVSVKMLIRRSRDLGLIDQGHERRLYMNYNRRGWNHGEPYDQDVEVEKPLMLRRAFEAIVDNSVVAREQVVPSLPFNHEDVEGLADLPRGYFDEANAERDMWEFLDDLTKEFPG